jgi:hypothetical protein
MAEWVATGVEPQRGKYSFRVKEDNEGESWIAAEPLGAGIKIVGRDGEDMDIGFRLRPDSSLCILAARPTLAARCFSSRSSFWRRHSSRLSLDGVSPRGYPRNRRALS